jgi:hypothetical protein
MEHLVKLLRGSYDLQEEKSEESAYWHLQQLRSEIKQLSLHNVVESFYGVFEPSGELVKAFSKEESANELSRELCNDNEGMRFFVRKENIE